MLYLTTGKPGAGKTLFTIYDVRARSQKEPERQIFYHGIKDLKLPWIHLDEPTKWYELPHGSIIVIDECQTFFRPRANGSQVPLYISEFETHRHKGFDVYLITQHPLLVDQNLRRLVGVHRNVVSMFGTKNARIHTWSRVKENCDKSNKDSDDSSIFKYPTDIYDVYKSAEVHTHKANIPRKVYALFFLVFLCLASAWFALHGIKKNVAHVEGDKLEQQSKASQVASAVSSEHDWFKDQVPRVAGLPHTAPVYDGLTKPHDVPAPQACVKMGDKCKCYTDQATPINMSDDICNNIVEHGIYLAYLDKKGNIEHSKDNATN